MAWPVVLLAQSGAISFSAAFTFKAGWFWAHTSIYRVLNILGIAAATSTVTSSPARSAWRLWQKNHFDGKLLHSINEIQHRPKVRIRKTIYRRSSNQTEILTSYFWNKPKDPPYHLHACSIPSASFGDLTDSQLCTLFPWSQGPAHCINVIWTKPFFIKQMSTSCRSGDQINTAVNLLTKDMTFSPVLELWSRYPENDA